ncbi:MAG: DNA-3-methyladenine glycosylase 2 [Ruminococcaceae bacterium]|nr:DNA-3-methyladenine glycosylase 2 [Oscillospiraceae bacterium]
MKIQVSGSDIIITGCTEFDLVHTFECGQCFRWNKTQDGQYEGVFGKKALKAAQQDDKITLFNTTIDEYENIWKGYFDLDRDYAGIQKILSKDDDVLKNAVKEGRGIRILSQEPFETIISFIISANNNIPRIKLIIERMCTLFGQKIEAYGREYCTFPDAKKIAALSREDLEPIKAGFRDKYILDAAQKICSGEVDIDKIATMDYESAKSELKKIKGVGDKVANCILLFGFGHKNAFPVDVWIRRIVEHYYFNGEAMGDIGEFAKKRFGELGGFAQQYLFYYARENKLEK